MTKKMKKNARFLLEEIAAGRSRIFYADDRPPGFLALERAGLAVRIPGTCRAALTIAGWEKFHELTVDTPVEA